MIILDDITVKQKNTIRSIVSKFATIGFLQDVQTQVHSLPGCLAKNISVISNKVPSKAGPDEF